MSPSTHRYALHAGIAIMAFCSAQVMASPPDPALPSMLLSGSAASAPPEEMVSRLIVKPRYRLGDKLNSALQVRDARGLAKIANVPMTVLRPMSGGAHVLELNQPVTLSEARVLASRLMRDGDNVELAEPDRIMHPSAVTPNDPGYAHQWHYMTPTPSIAGGANLPNAWSITTGSAAVTVAVLDTGYRQHVDMGAVLPGYDFISDVAIANDGDGRDADAQDPGDWITAAENASGIFQGCKVERSSWHGTHVAGTIAALMNNSIGVTGVAPNVKILPVRVLGKCGGYTSDIIDGMRWAAGIAVAGTPANPYPAQVLNMSFGIAGTCSSALQSAVAEVIGAGKVIVAATGNDGAAAIGEPANCTGVIAVTAHAIDGDHAEYANAGPETTISAPGGGCGADNTLNNACTAGNSPGVYSLVNTGLTTPSADSYVAYQGTSMAAPHVTGVAALMFSLNLSLTPAQLKAYLQSSARPHPAGSTCISKYPGKCGAGLLDAQQALNAVIAPPPVVTLGDIPTVVAPNTTVTLTGSAVAGAGRNLESYRWTQQTGPVAVAITGANTANAYFTAPPTGTYSFMLTATDNGGQTGTATAVIRVNSPPVLNAVPAQTITQGQTLNFTVSATDVDGDVPIFHAVSLPSGATLSATGVFSWPNAAPAGSHTLIYYASDGYANSAQGSVTITVTAPPGGGGGGGSPDAELLATLALLAVSLRLRRRVNP